ncbi:MAG TPA: MFS transporter, partial [bacterium]|nr:MFS transporter [bacterium]
MPDDSLTAAPAAVPASPFAPLRHRNFRLLWTGMVVSNTGSWMQFVALGYLVD